MNRHHPYGNGGGGGGGNMYDGGRRGGPGPDRQHRFPNERGRGGRGRGRGGYNNQGYGRSPSFDDGPSSYGQWNDGPSGPPTDPYYGQNADYDEPYGGDYDNGSPPYNDRNDQSYGKHEDKGFRGRGRGRGRGGFFPRSQEEEKIQKSIIEERINRERPCRTLFIRNIKYETDGQHMRNMFEDFGEIKTFYDRIGDRGMVFVTFYDMRGAERARDHLQGTIISERPIDVHFSLPRPDELEGKDPRDLNYGTILATMINSGSGHPINENELQRAFQTFGDIKTIRHGENFHDQRYVEYFDSRACTDAYDTLHQQPFQDGFLTLDIVADIPDIPLPPGAAPRFEDKIPRIASESNDFRGRGRGGGRGQRGRGGPSGRDDWDRRDDFNRDFDRPRDDFVGGGGRGRNYDNFGGGRGRGGDDFGGGRGRGGRGRGGRGGFNNDFNDRHDGGRRDFGRPPPDNYGPPPPASGPPPPPSFNGPLSSPSQGPDDRLEQAKKVQQLLAALKQPQGSGPAAPPSVPPPPGPGAPPPSFWPPPAGGPLPPPMYGGPPPPMPGMPPPPPHFVMPPPGSNAQGPPPAVLASAGLPPNIMAMLQQASQNPALGGPPPLPSSAPYGMPTGPPGSQGGSSAQDYQALMSYLNQKQ